MFCTYLNLKAIAADQSMIEPVFTRGLPQNRLELSQIIANLKGVVSTKTLLALLDFVSNVDDEMKEVKKKNRKHLKHRSSYLIPKIRILLQKMKKKQMITRKMVIMMMTKTRNNSALL